MKRLLLLAGTGNPALADLVSAELGVTPARRSIDSFPDGEVHIEITDEVRGCDVYVLQPTGPPVAQNLIELLLLADACRRSGAFRLTAVVGYLGYARQSHRTREREPLAMRVAADMIGAS